MIKIYPAAISNEMISDLIERADHASARPYQSGVKNLSTIHPIKHPANKIISTNIGKLGGVELLTYTEGSYSDAHDDVDFSGNQLGWVATGLLFASDPNEYTGGELVFNKLNIEMKPPKGTLIWFPIGNTLTSYTHSVKPITSGKRIMVVYRFIEEV
jgi:predicted 2-oxoglutarate/Fe(II)-dependent dioxygenase YbiX